MCLQCGSKAVTVATAHVVTVATAQFLSDNERVEKIEEKQRDVAIPVAMISMLIIKSIQAKSIEGKPIIYKPKPFHKGVVIGGTLFGAGWAITGACPGPIYAQVGAGAWMGLITLVGALMGMYLYAVLQPKLPH